MGSKGPSQVGTQTTTSVDPRAATQQPYLQQSWDTARDTLNNQGINQSGYNALNQAASAPWSGVTDAINSAYQPFLQANAGQMGVQNSPAGNGYSTIANNGSFGQQLAQQNANLISGYGSRAGATGEQYAAPIGNYAGQSAGTGTAYGNTIGGLAGQSAPTGQQYANLIGQTAAGTPGAVADPMQKLQQQSSGYYLNSNPYLDQMYGSAADAVRSNYQTATAPRTASSYEGAGRYGSPSAQNAVSQNEQNLGRTLDTLAGNIYGQNYSQERGLQNNATVALGNLGLGAQGQMMQGYGAAGNQALAGLGQGISGYGTAANTALAGLGQGISGYNTAGNQQLAGYNAAGNLFGTAGNLGLSGSQQQLSALGGLQGAYQFGNSAALQAAGMLPQMQQGYTYGPQQQVAAIQGLAQQPWDQLRNYSSIINAQNPFQSQTTQQPIYGSGIGQTLGGLGSLASGIGSIAGLFGASDRRIKENTRVVGHIGKLPLHTFHYKGDPQKRLGFMADEVEQVDPGAVVMTNLGFKAVNYGRATQSALQE